MQLEEKTARGLRFTNQIRNIMISTQKLLQMDELPQERSQGVVSVEKDWP